MFLILKTYQKYAKESIEVKKKERYTKAIYAYNDLLKEFRRPVIRQMPRLFTKSATRSWEPRITQTEEKIIVSSIFVHMDYKK